MPLDSLGWASSCQHEMAAGRIKWLATRHMPWVERPPAGTPDLVVPGPFPGIACVLFGVGPQGVGWLGRMQRSAWFRAVRPRPLDLAGVEAGGGSWVPRVGPAVMPASLPWSPLFTVAVPADLSPADTDTALDLVRAFRHRSGPQRPRVVVTLDGPRAERAGLADRFRQLGAFVIRNAGHLPPDHFHHFPASAATHWGELVCTDLADFLVCWSHGDLADLHLVRFDNHTAHREFDVAFRPRPVAAVNLLSHMPRMGHDRTLVVLDRFMEACRDAMGSRDTHLVCTTRDRLDGVTGTADLLLVDA